MEAHRPKKRVDASWCKRKSARSASDLAAAIKLSRFTGVFLGWKFVAIVVLLGLVILACLAGFAGLASLFSA